jgi:hypothetical protein
MAAQFRKSPRGSCAYGLTAATIVPFAQLTLDYQWIRNPAYNLDRGPVSVFALRIHIEH